VFSPLGFLIRTRGMQGNDGAAVRRNWSHGVTCTAEQNQVNTHAHPQKGTRPQNVPYANPTPHHIHLVGMVLVSRRGRRRKRGGGLVCTKNNLSKSLQGKVARGPNDVARFCNLWPSSISHECSDHGQPCFLQSGNRGCTREKT